MSDKHQRIAVCPGSFDPVTFGHLDIITRASKLFDKVIVLVSTNLDKRPAFTLTERLLMIRQVTQNFENVFIDILEESCSRIMSAESAQWQSSRVSELSPILNMNSRWHSATRSSCPKPRPSS